MICKLTVASSPPTMRSWPFLTPHLQELVGTAISESDVSIMVVMGHISAPPLLSNVRGDINPLPKCSCTLLYTVEVVAGKDFTIYHIHIGLMCLHFEIRTSPSVS